MWLIWEFFALKTFLITKLSCLFFQVVGKSRNFKKILGMKHAIRNLYWWIFSLFIYVPISISHIEFKAGKVWKLKNFLPKLVGFLYVEQHKEIEMINSLIPAVQYPKKKHLSMLNSLIITAILKHLHFTIHN